MNHADITPVHGPGQERVLQIMWILIYIYRQKVLLCSKLLVNDADVKNTYITGMLDHDRSN